MKVKILKEEPGPKSSPLLLPSEEAPSLFIAEDTMSEKMVSGLDSKQVKLLVPGH